MTSEAALDASASSRAAASTSAKCRRVRTKRIALITAKQRMPSVSGRAAMSSRSSDGMVQASRTPALAAAQAGVPGSSAETATMPARNPRRRRAIGAHACALCCGRAPKPSTAIRIASGIPACPIAAFAGVERLPARGSRGGVPRSAERPANQSTLPPRRIAPEVGQIVNMPAVENAQEERISCGRWALSLRPPCEFEPFIQGGVTAHRRGHQEAVALGEDALHVVDINVRVADDNVVPLTGLDDPRHPLEHLGMLVLPRVSELLGEVALADEDGADAGHLLQDLR